MVARCSGCGKRYAYSVIAAGDFERSFDFTEQWQGLRLLCPGCGTLQRTSFAPLTFTNDAPEGAGVDGFRVHAVVGQGPEVVPFPGGTVSAA